MNKLSRLPSRWPPQRAHHILLRRGSRLSALALALAPITATAAPPSQDMAEAAEPGGSLVEAVQALEALRLGRDPSPLRLEAGRRQCAGQPYASASLMRPSRLLRGHPGNAARIPQDIACSLTGRPVHSFAHFRRLLWQAVAASPYAAEFSPLDHALMRLGQAPLVPDGQRVGRRRTYELHHVRPIARGGALYDLSNLMIVTPLYHASVLSPRYHFGHRPTQDDSHLPRP